MLQLPIIRKMVAVGVHNLGYLEEKLLEFLEIFAGGQVIIGQVKDFLELSPRIDDSDVSPPDIPSAPDIVLLCILEPRQRPIGDDQRIESRESGAVYPEDLHIQVQFCRLELSLQIFEVPELGTAVTSAGIAEIIGADLKQIIARRNLGALAV